MQPGLALCSSCISCPWLRVRLVILFLVIHPAWFRACCAESHLPRFSLQKCQYCELLDLVLYKEEEHREDVLHRLEEIRYTPGAGEVCVSGNTFWRVQAELSIHVFEETGWLVRKGCPSRNSWRAKCCWKWPGSVFKRCYCSAHVMVEPEAAMCNFVILKLSFSFSAIGCSIMLFAGPDDSGKLFVDDQGRDMLKFSMWALAFPPIFFTWHYIPIVFLKFVGILWALYGWGSGRLVEGQALL